MANLFSFLGEGPSAGLTPLELTAFTRAASAQGRRERPHVHTVYYHREWRGHAGQGRAPGSTAQAEALRPLTITPPNHQGRAPGSPQCEQRHCGQHTITPLAGQAGPPSVQGGGTGPGARVLTARTGLQQRLHCSRQPEDARSCVAVHCGHWRATSPEVPASPPPPLSEGHLGPQAGLGFRDSSRVTSQARLGRGFALGTVGGSAESAPPERADSMVTDSLARDPAPHWGGRALAGPCPTRDDATQTACVRLALGTTETPSAAQVLQRGGPGPASGFCAFDQPWPRNTSAAAWGAEILVNTSFPRPSEQSPNLASGP